MIRISDENGNILGYDEIKDEEAGDDGIAIPVIKGDGPETAAGIAGYWRKIRRRHRDSGHPRHAGTT